MNVEQADTPRTASTLFIRIAEFASRPVIEQARLTERLDAITAQAIAGIPPAARIVLDVPGGAAIIVTSCPEWALAAAERASGCTGGEPFKIGIDFGPLTIAAGLGGQPAFRGDALSVAATVSDFAGAGRFVATRAFRDALNQRAPHRAHGLVPAGVFTDAQVRSFDVYAPDTRAARLRTLRILVWGTIGVALFLGSGFGVRHVRKELIRLAQPAVIIFEIKPQGEIIVDGMLKGRSPPLTQIEVRAGYHGVVVRNGAFPPLNLDAALEPGERMTIKHTFVASKPKAKPEPEGFWQDLRKKLWF